MKISSSHILNCDDTASTSTDVAATDAKVFETTDAAVRSIYNYVNADNIDGDDVADEDSLKNSDNDKFYVSTGNDKDKDFSSVAEGEATAFLKQQKSKMPLEVNAVVNWGFLERMDD